MSYTKDVGEVSARYRPGGEVPSVNGETWIDAVQGDFLYVLTDEEWIEVWARHDQYPA